jgi:predicted secreted protein
MNTNYTIERSVWIVKSKLHTWERLVYYCSISRFGKFIMAKLELSFLSLSLVFCVVFCRSLFVLLSFDLRFTDSDCWFSPGTPVSSTNKTDRHDIAEILLKVVLNTITLIPYTPIHKSVHEERDIWVYRVCIYYIIQLWTNIWHNLEKTKQNRLSQM